MKTLFSGSGPGNQTSDGCSVELYKRLPYLGELDPVRAIFRDAVNVLELGCGTGRLTAQMLGWGATVTAVDNSAEMLEAVPVEAVKVLSNIETLELEERFSLVVLASGLINHPSTSVRRDFLSAAQRHLAIGGQFFLERHDADWLANVRIGKQGAVGDIAIFVESAKHKNGSVRIALRYQQGIESWRQSFDAVILHECQVEEMLACAGFDVQAWFGKTKRWVRATVSKNRKI